MGCAGKGDPVLVMHDRMTKTTFAFVAPAKGAGYQKVITRICSHLDQLGHHSVVLKSDQERAMVAVQDKVKKYQWMQEVGRDIMIERPDNTTFENKPVAEVVRQNSPVGESQSNGDVERAI